MEQTKICHTKEGWDKIKNEGIKVELFCIVFFGEANQLF